MILMDIMMPRMTGCEAAKAIRALPGRPDAAKIPIIAMTANAFAEDVQASLAAGMDAHLSKPFGGRSSPLPARPARRAREQKEAVPQRAPSRYEKRSSRFPLGIVTVGAIVNENGSRYQ